jgi:hypothetical protein
VGPGDWKTSGGRSLLYRFMGYQPSQRLIYRCDGVSLSGSFFIY